MTLTKNFAQHGLNCDCFECASPDHVLGVNHADWLRDVNDYLGFGIHSGDTIEITKVVNKYDGKGGGKVIAPPTHLIIDHVTPEFIYFVDGTYIYNNPDTYIQVPAAIKHVLDTGDKAVESVKDFGSNLGDVFTGFISKIKWLLIGIVVILIIVLILKFK